MQHVHVLPDIDVHNRIFKHMFARRWWLHMEQISNSSDVSTIEFRFV